MIRHLIPVLILCSSWVFLAPAVVGAQESGGDAPAQADGGHTLSLLSLVDLFLRPTKACSNQEARECTITCRWCNPITGKWETGSLCSLLCFFGLNPGLPSLGYNSSGSHIDNWSMAYHHLAADYQHSKPEVGCTSCGGTAPDNVNLLPRFSLMRTHRPRDLYRHSSFGPGVFSNYDISLRFHRFDGTTLADFFEPFNTGGERFADGPYAAPDNFSDEDTRDGRFTPYRFVTAQTFLKFYLQLPQRTQRTRREEGENSNPASVLSVFSVVYESTGIGLSSYIASTPCATWCSTPKT